ncbi:MAG TPA: hypothetical protein VJA26_11045 [Gammaproteobacteria bacterium]|nr:hypothetical protein [Gammaproteobacteria bacterium]
MASRRELMQYALAVSALAAVPLARSASRVAAPEHHSLFKVIVDRTLDGSAAFAAEAARRSAPVQMLGSDIGSVWINEIEPHLRNRPAAIAGFTGGAPLFCLELLARDYGMRVVYRAEHSPCADGRMAHSVTGADALADWAGVLRSAKWRWSTVAAELATTCPREVQPSPNTALLDLSERPGIARQSQFSWLIAPYARSLIIT